MQNVNYPRRSKSNPVAVGRHARLSQKPDTTFGHNFVKYKPIFDILWTQYPVFLLSLAIENLPAPHAGPQRHILDIEAKS